MKHKKTILITVIFLIIAVLSVNELIPQSIDNEFYNINVSDNIEYQSELTDIHNKQYGVYAFLNDEPSETGNRQFVISVLEIKGIFKNQESLVSYSPLTDDYILNPEYKNIVNMPEREIKNGSKYYGSVYCGIAPLDCKEITVDGKKADLHRMTFEINGKTADFYLYYCVTEQNEYPESCKLICTKESGEKIQIIAEDGEEYSQVIPLN